jgi:hypothetical protein
LTDKGVYGMIIFLMKIACQGVAWTYLARDEYQYQAAINAIIMLRVA